MTRSPILALALAASLIAGSAWCVEPPAGPPHLYVDCRGPRTSAPTVILESGAFGTSADWDQVIDDLARDGRVCAYDRGGVGASPPLPGATDVKAIAAELASLLDDLGERGPVILVGHSNGALYIETFAALWPARVAGLVYVNGVTSDDLDDPVLVRSLDEERCLSDMAVVVAQLGLAPVVAPIVVKAEGLTGAAAARKREALTSLASLRVARDEDRAIVPGLAEARALGGSPGAIPTVVIVGAIRPQRPSALAWRAAETASARRARTSWILDAPGASHVSPLARDRAYIVAAVQWLRSAQSGAPTP